MIREKSLVVRIITVRHWHYYLITCRFTIRTDKKRLKHLLEQKVTTSLQHAWLTKLMGYDYDIVYKKDYDNSAADALSRVSGT